MDFRIADTFTDALTKLPVNDQKAVKVSVMDLQLDSTAPGLQLHRIDKSKDPNFWSARVSRDIRLILHKTASSLLVLPCFEPPQAPKRSLSVAAQPSCIQGPREDRPRSEGTWNMPPVPTSIVALSPGCQ